ncbi:uncharacterized protein FIBRA_06248 [Fibroporia radiculosa]|uniref:Ubinuclein middle domain-containing protein n=1 Tax=Fibroporia radiculosa TaxID=599839 RepID=J4H3Z2_9APHY|nr:uncharacterized protein FIBRA_06248 [Fibroporia radiculosa]CCM04089.1 predicted protein [Fibroporia radiculosa]
MASDAEVFDDLVLVYPSSSSRLPSPSPQHHSSIPIDASDDSRLSVPNISVSSKPRSKVASVVRIDDSAAAKGRKAKPSSVIAAKPASSVGAKPKSTKSAAPRSPSPSPPPPARPPLETIRLDIPLGGPEDYEVDITLLSKATGQRPSTPVPPSKRDISDDDSHSEGDDEGDGKKDKRKRKKRKNVSSEYYDTADPFIDDSELAQDERTFFAQTKQKGFYVSSGQVALLNKTPKKPKSKKLNILAPSASVTAALSSGPLPPSLAASLSLPPAPSTSKMPSSPKKPKSEHGSRDEPIPLYSDVDDEQGQGMKRKLAERHSPAPSPASNSQESVSKKRRKTVEIQPFNPELEIMLDALRAAIGKENWEVKGKFPPSLKPLLAQVALKAVMLGEYDDNFFNMMPRLFPYNKFTMSKLIKRTIWREHTNLLLERQNALLQELKILADEGFPKAREEWEKSVTSWEKRQERAKAEAEAGGGSVAHSVEGTPAASDSQPTPRIGAAPLAQRPSLDDGGNDTGVEHDDGAGTGTGKSKESHRPGKKYRLTDTMKGVIWQLVCLSNECCRIENEKNVLEGSNQIVSDQGVRKTLYQKIVGAFPDGWLSSGQISREVSVMKKKYEKEVMEYEG